MRMQRLRLAIVLVALIATVRGLHALGAVEGFALPRQGAAWVLQAPLEDLVGVALRLTALAGAYWLLATTLLYLLARAVGAALLARAAGWATLPAVRRLADRAVGLALVSVVVAPSAALASIPPEPDPQVMTTPPVEAALPPLPVALPAAAAPTPAPSGTVAAAEHRVAPGDHLWGIAADHLGATRAVDAGTLAPGDIAPYWAAVVAANADRLPSGDPDLLYPGDVVLLPEPDRS